MYGYWSFNDLTSECRHYKLQTRFLVREDAIGKRIKVIVSRKKKRKINLVMGPKGRPDTKTNWSTVCRPQEELQLNKAVYSVMRHSADVYADEKQEALCIVC
jgi:hypothetical protein